LNSDVDVAVVADGVSAFHIKQPLYSNDFLCVRMEEEGEKEKEREGRRRVQRFLDKLP